MKQRSGFPKSIPYIIANEAAERFSFYGMKAVLTTFLAAQFFNPMRKPELEELARARASEETHFFITLAYFTPVLGGLIADWFLGKYRTILYISLFYCVGHACLALFEDNYSLFMTGLVLIALGAGGIKPCVSANMGDQFDHTNQHLLPRAFSMFYFSINFGAFFSTLLTPWLMKHYGPSMAFGVPGLLMALATFIFWLGRKQYVKVPPTGYRRANFVAINLYALSKIGKKRKGASLLDMAADQFSQESIEGVKAVWRVLGVFAFIPVYWALWDQSGAEWVLQASHRYMDLHFAGIDWLPEQVQAINPILILLFIPLVDMIVYPWIEKCGVRVTPLRKIGAGFVLMIFTFVVITCIQMRLDRGIVTSIGWQLLAYVLLTASEVMVSVTGLEFAYTQAPPSMKSTIMAFWFLTVSMGNYIVSLINKNIAGGGFFAQFSGASYYGLFTVIITVVTIIYFLMSYRFLVRSYLLSDEDKNAQATLPYATNNTHTTS